MLKTCHKNTPPPLLFLIFGSAIWSFGLFRMISLGPLPVSTNGKKYQQGFCHCCQNFFPLFWT